MNFNKIHSWVLKNKTIGWYYRAQQYVDIAWAEASWFSDSLIELMAVVFFLEKLGFEIDGIAMVTILVGAFIGTYFAGMLFKKIGTYDKSVYIDAEIDPVEAEILKAARIINKKFGKK